MKPCARSFTRFVPSLLLLSASASAGRSQAGEVPGSPDHNQKEKAAIERLVKNLSSDSKSKQKAGEEGLLEAGEAAIPELKKLLDHPKEEIRERARRILSRLDEEIPTPSANAQNAQEEKEPTDRRKEAADLAKLIRETRQVHEGAEAVLKLRRLGRAGLSAWIDLFPARNLAREDLDIRAAALPRPLRPGESFRISAIVANRSKEPVWISAWHALSIRASGDGRTFDLGTAPCPYPDDVDGAVAMLSDLYDQILLAPGETLPILVDCKAPDRPGRHLLRARYDANRSFAEVLEASRKRGRELLDAPGKITFQQNDGLIRGSPDILTRDFDLGTIEVSVDGDAAR